MRKFTLGFYNLENLFDTRDDPRTMDDDFTADSPRRWNEKRFQKKVRKLGRVISHIGYSEILYPPVLVGIAEVENEEVVRALVESKYLRKKGYDLVHFDSPDERGIDTALIYRSKFFRVLEQQVHALNLTDSRGRPDHTRDVLHVYGELEGAAMHVLVNHWPSRRAGVSETEPRRLAAAEKNKEIVRQIRYNEPDARIVVMGDFNDDPASPSIRSLVDESLHNPMERLQQQGLGSLNHRGDWNLFDQILISPNLLPPPATELEFRQAGIHDPTDIREFRGRFKGNPFRTYAGKRYLGGFSDHFPVYSVFGLR